MNEMDGIAVLSVVIILAAIIISYWKEIFFSIVASIACIAVYIIMVPTNSISYLGFVSHDLIHPERLYTVLTSMFAHSDEDMWHIIYNLFGLVFIGLAFEQRIGTKPFVILYMLSGFFGTLTFALVRWDEQIPVVGASGAIMGILGGFGRLYPRERMSFILGFMPLPPMPIWIIVVIFIGLQYLLIGTDVAVEAHLGGIAAGILLAPLVVRMPKMRREGRRVSLSVLSRLATTPKLKTILKRIQNEQIEDVRNAWIEDFLARARCPECGSRIRLKGDTAICERGHTI